MGWIYNTEKRTIRRLTKHSKKHKLSKMESKLVEVLINNEMTRWEDICVYMYGYYDKYTARLITKIKFSLLQKVKLTIRSKYRVGLKLIDDVYIL